MTGTPASGLDRLRQNIQLAYRGSARAVDLVLTALFSRGHILIEDVPGVGKTTLARALGRSLSLEFRRIQFTSDTLPADVLGRRKQGFSPPFSAWARGPMRSLVDDTLSYRRVVRAGVLDPGATREVVNAHLENRADRGRTLWTLLSLQMWAERWVAGASSESQAAASRAPATTAQVGSHTAATTAGAE